MKKGYYGKLPKFYEVFWAKIVDIDPDTKKEYPVNGCAGLFGEDQVMEFFKNNGIDSLNIEYVP